MGVPHDFASLWRNKHTFEVKNTGGVTLPAFSLAEIDGADSIESDNRSIVEVKRPTANSLDTGRLCVIGPIDIAVGDFGSASIDYPLYVTYTGSPTTGQIWGSALNSTNLTSGQEGFRIVGDATGTVVKVNLSILSSGSTSGVSNILRAQLSADMCSTDGTGSIDNVEFLSGWAGATPATVVNGLKLAGTDDDIIYAVYRSSTGNWEILNVQHVRNTYLEKLIEPTEITGGQIPTLDAGQDPSDPGCDYKFRKLQTPMVKEPIGGGTCVQEAFDEINFAPCAVLTDLRYGQDASGNPTIEGKVKIVWVPDQCDEVPDEWVEVLMGTECPTGT